MIELASGSDDGGSVVFLIHQVMSTDEQPHPDGDEATVSAANHPLSELTVKHKSNTYIILQIAVIV